MDGQLTDDGVEDNTIDTQQLLVSTQHHCKKSPTSSKKVGRGNTYCYTLNVNTYIVETIVGYRLCIVKQSSW